MSEGTATPARQAYDARAAGMGLTLGLSLLYVLITVPPFFSMGIVHQLEHLFLGLATAALGASVWVGLDRQHRLRASTLVIVLLGAAMPLSLLIRPLFNPPSEMHLPIHSAIALPVAILSLVCFRGFKAGEPREP